MHPVVQWEQCNITDPLFSEIIILTLFLAYKIMIWVAQNADILRSENACIHALNGTLFLVLHFGQFNPCPPWFEAEQWFSVLWNVHTETSHGMRPLYQPAEPHQGMRNKSNLQKSQLHLASHQMWCLRKGTLQKVIELKAIFKHRQSGKRILVHCIDK